MVVSGQAERHAPVNYEPDGRFIDARVQTGGGCDDGNFTVRPGVLNGVAICVAEFGVVGFGR